MTRTRLARARTGEESSIWLSSNSSQTGTSSASCQRYSWLNGKSSVSDSSRSASWTLIPSRRATVRNEIRCCWRTSRKRCKGPLGWGTGAATA